MQSIFGKLLGLLNALGTVLIRYKDPTASLPAGFLAEGSNTRQVRTSDYFEKETNRAFMSPPFVTTNLGSFEGYFMKVISGRDVYAFEGIAYAEPPQRFRAPIPKKPFDGIFQAKSPGNDCLQMNSGGVAVGDGLKLSPLLGKSDCLTCNIYTPEIASEGRDPKLPVIFNIYGGSFVMGSAKDAGPSYLLEEDVILVNCNYRVGVLGFLSTGDDVAPGNWGLKDLKLAFEWVHQNIKEFGGDPSRITIMGQSAGGVLAHLLAMSPSVKDKAHGLVALGGNAFVPWAIADKQFANKITWRFAVMNFCPTNQGTLAMVNCLRRRPSLILTGAQNVLYATELAGFHFTPVVEPNIPDALITKPPEQMYSNNLVGKIPAIFSINSRDADMANFIFTQIGIFGLILKSVLVFIPQIFGFQGKVENEQEASNRIVEFYGGIEKISTDKDRIFQMFQDGLFTTGVWKSIELHSKVAPTYAQTFDYKSTVRSMAHRFLLDPKDYGVPHSEDLFYMFNRTDVKPIERTHEDFTIVKLMRHVYTDFARFGKPNYQIDEDDFSDNGIAHPANPSMDTFKMIVIDKEVKQTDTPFETNVTKFWDSLNINNFPSAPTEGRTL